MNTPILIACAHGTSSPHGAAEVNALRDGIAGLRPGLDVREAYVDVQDPDLPAVVAGLPAGVTAVVVPLLLSVGYHVKVDIARRELSLAVKQIKGRGKSAQAQPDAPGTQQQPQKPSKHQSKHMKNRRGGAPLRDRQPAQKFRNQKRGRRR